MPIPATVPAVRSWLVDHVDTIYRKMLDVKRDGPAKQRRLEDFLIVVRLVASFDATFDVGPIDPLDALAVARADFESLAALVDEPMLDRIAANEAKRQADDAIAAMDRQLGELRSLLNDIAIALKGDPAPYHSHTWDDLPALARQAVARAAGK